MVDAFVVFEGPDVFREHAERWDALVTANDAGSLRAGAGDDALPGFFLRSQWLDPWAREGREDARVFLGVKTSGEEWVAGIPLQLRSGKVGRFQVTKLDFAGAPWTDSAGIPATGSSAREAAAVDTLRWAREELSGWTVADFRELGDGGRSAEALVAAARECGLAWERRECSRAPLLNLKAWEEEGRPLSKSLRKQVKRSKKKLEAAGEVLLEFTIPDSVQAALLFEEVAEVEGASWKGLEGRSHLAAGASTRPFFSALWQDLAEEGRLAVGACRVDGKMIAFHWGPRSGDRFLSYHLAFREEQRQLGAGTVIFHHMVEKGTELGFEWMDASRGELDAPHLLSRYGGPARSQEQVLVWAPGLRSTGIRAARALRGLIRATKKYRAPTIGRLSLGG